MFSMTRANKQNNLLCLVSVGQALNHMEIVPPFYAVVTSALTLCIQETAKRVLLLTVKTQMKYSIIMLHFIRAYTVCKSKTALQTKEFNIFVCKIITGHP